MARDPYQELGVSKSAKADEIQRAFRKLAKQYHPDKNPGDKKSEERFKQVSAAFDLVGDEEKRARYDRGEIDADGRETMRANGYGGGGSSWGTRSGGAGGAGFEGADLDDFLSQVFTMREGGRGFNIRGADVRAKLEIDLEEAILGGTKRIAFSDGRTLDVTIPAGAQNGQHLRLKGQGQPGRNGQAGDALIELEVKPHPLYRLEGADLHMDLPVTVPDAVLGGKVQAPTPDGSVTLTVPKGSNTGTVLRLKGRGASAAPGGRRGDLFAHLVVTLPDTPDLHLERFSERWRDERPYSAKRRA